MEELISRLHLQVFAKGDSSACIYKSSLYPGFVWKVNSNISLHEKEVRFYSILRNSRLTPKLDLHFMHNGVGYMKLEEIIPVKQDTKHSFDLEKFLPDQCELIDMFIILTEMGIIHMDSHPRNLGFNSKNKLVIYDFEYAQIRSLQNEKRFTIAFSLFLLLDFVETDQIIKSTIWKYVKQEIGDKIFIWCQEKIIKKNVSKKIFLKKACKISSSNTDIVFACLCSIVVLLTPLSVRFDLSLYKYITETQTRFVG